MKRFLCISAVILLGAMVGSSAFAAPKKHLKIGYAVSYGTNTTVPIIIQGAKDEFAKAKWADKYDIELIVTDAGSQDVGTKMSADLEDLYAQKVDGLLVFPADASTQAGVVIRDLYNKKGIPVAITDIGIPFGDYVCFTITDNYKGGQIAAEYAAKFMKKGDKAQGWLSYAGSQNAQQRVKGYESKMKELGMRVLPTAPIQNSTAESGQSHMEDLLTSDPDIKSVFVVTYPPFIGAAKVLSDRGLAGKVFLTMFDIDKVTLELLRSGAITCAIMQDMHGLGQKAAEQLMTYISGAKVVNKDIMLPPILLNKSNLKDYENTSVVQPFIQ
jgi:ribose transport system substrate-binding protein